MQFNPTDKSKSIIADIDFLLFGNGEVFDESYSLTDRTRSVNASLDEIISALFKADPNFMWDDTTNEDFPIATVNLEASKTNYVIPDSSLRVHRFRIKTATGNWKTLTPRLRRELSDDELSSTGEPESYFKLDNAIFPIPVPNYGYTAGAELEFQRGANHFATSDTDKSPGFSSQFHQFLSVGAALRFAMANGMKEKISFLSAEKSAILTRVEEHYQRRSPDERPRLRLAKNNPRQYALSIGSSRR